MPKYNNKFRNPAYFEQVIQNEAGNVIGTVRLKPSSVQWKPKGAQKFHSVSLEKFAEWITNPKTGSRKTIS